LTKEKHAKTTANRVRNALLMRCGFATLADVSAVRIQEALAGMTKATPAPSPPKDGEGYRKAELSAILGIRSAGVAVTRLGLPATGAGKARRFPVETARALAARQSKGAGEGTAGAYARDLRCFGRWLLRRGRVAVNPLADLAGSPRADGRHQRRALGVDELGRLLSSAKAGGTFRGLSGEGRHALDLVAMSTSFRAGELALLTPQRFRLDETPPVVVLEEGERKNGCGVHQPLPASSVGQIRAWLAGESEGLPLWPGAWAEKPVEVMCFDLKAAGIDLRHSGAERRPAVRRLPQSAAQLEAICYLQTSPKRHKDLRRLVGTGVSSNAQVFSPPDPRGYPERVASYTPLTQDTDGKGGKPMAPDGDAPETPPPSVARNPLSRKEIDGERG